MWSKILNASCFCFLCICLIIIGKVGCSKENKQLIRDLQEGYSGLERPVLNEADPVTVVMGLTLQQIIDVDEINQVIKINLWLNYKWTDEHMRWEPSEYGGIKQVRLLPKYLWIPDILLYNSVSESFDSTFPVNVVVSHDGAMEWIPPSIVTSTCKIDITWFPFDDQKCTLKFGSWTHNGMLINLTLGDIVTSTYTLNGEWELIDVFANRSVFLYDCCPEPYIDITFTLWIRRRTLYYGFNLIVPCLLISMMSWLDFILPVDSGEKMGLGITIFMSLCVFLLMVAEALPPTSDAVPLIGVFFCTTMVVVSLSNVFNVLVLNLHYRRPETHTMHPVVRQIFLNWLPWLLMMKRPGYRMGWFKLTKIPKADPIGAEEALSNALVERKRSSDSKSLLMDNDHNHLDDLLRRNPPFNEAAAALGMPQPLPPCLSDSLLVIVPVLNALHKELSVITKKMKDDEEDSAVINDWKFAGMVLDRLCLIIFVSALSGCVIGIFLYAPHIL